MGRAMEVMKRLRNAERLPEGVKVEVREGRVADWRAERGAGTSCREPQYDYCADLPDGHMA